MQYGIVNVPCVSRIRKPTKTYPIIFGRLMLAHVTLRYIFDKTGESNVVSKFRDKNFRLKVFAR